MPRLRGEMSYKLRILSLGAGVQSSTILLMSNMGLLPKLDAAIIADVGWESRVTYDWLYYLRAVCSIPIIEVSGGNIKNDLLENSGTSRSMPFWTMVDGNVGRMRRQCTQKYKVAPVDKESQTTRGAVREEGSQGGCRNVGGDIL